MKTAQPISGRVNGLTKQSTTCHPMIALRMAQRPHSLQCCACSLHGGFRNAWQALKIFFFLQNYSIFWIEKMMFMIPGKHTILFSFLHLHAGKSLSQNIKHLSDGEVTHLWSPSLDHSLWLQTRQCSRKYVATFFFKNVWLSLLRFPLSEMNWPHVCWRHSKHPEWAMNLHVVTYRVKQNHSAIHCHSTSSFFWRKNIKCWLPVYRENRQKKDWAMKDKAAVPQAMTKILTLGMPRKYWHRRQCSNWHIMGRPRLLGLWKV